MKFATKPNDNTHLTLGMLLHYLGKLEIQIFCRYSADMAEMQTYCILIASNFVVHPRAVASFKSAGGTRLPRGGHEDRSAEGATI